MGRSHPVAGAAAHQHGQAISRQDGTDLLPVKGDDSIGLGVIGVVGMADDPVTVHLFQPAGLAG